MMMHTQQMCLYRDVLGCKVSDPQPLPDHGVTVVFVQVENTKVLCPDNRIGLCLKVCLASILSDRVA
eukprot:SAG31_NODE_189_length_20842_cov_12.518151_2_plen_67_part_00